MTHYRLTTWYYALGVDDALHRVPARVPEQLLLGDEELAGVPRPEWVRDFGGIILAGVLIALDERRPVSFVGMGAGLLRATPECPDTLPHPFWERLDLAERLARTAGHRAGVRADRVGALREFLLYHQINLPVVAAKSSGGNLGLKGFLDSWSDSVNQGLWDVWDIASGEIVPGTRG